MLQPAGHSVAWIGQEFLLIERPCTFWQSIVERAQIEAVRIYVVLIHVYMRHVVHVQLFRQLLGEFRFAGRHWTLHQNHLRRRRSKTVMWVKWYSDFQPWNYHRNDVLCDRSMNESNCTVYSYNRMAAVVWCHSSRDRLCSKCSRLVADMAIGRRPLSIEALDSAPVAPICFAVLLPSSNLLTICSVTGEERKKRTTKIRLEMANKFQTITSATSKWLHHNALT